MAAGLPTSCVVGSGSWGDSLRRPHGQPGCRGEALVPQRRGGVSRQRNAQEPASPHELRAAMQRHRHERRGRGALRRGGRGPGPAVHAPARRLPRARAPRRARRARSRALQGHGAGTHQLMLDVAAAELGHAERMAVLSGPNHAEEICQGQVSAARPGLREPRGRRAPARPRDRPLLPRLRLRRRHRRRGLRRHEERRGHSLRHRGRPGRRRQHAGRRHDPRHRGDRPRLRRPGRKPAHPHGPCRHGRPRSTCTSEHSRNRTFGEAFVAGEGLAAYEARTGMVVEGAHAAQSFWELAHDRGIEAPLTCAVHDVLVDGLDLASASASLLGRLPREEFYGLSRTTESKGII